MGDSLDDHSGPLSKENKIGRIHSTTLGGRLGRVVNETSRKLGRPPSLYHIRRLTANQLSSGCMSSNLIVVENFFGLGKLFLYLLTKYILCYTGFAFVKKKEKKSCWQCTSTLQCRFSCFLFCFFFFTSRYFVSVFIFLANKKIVHKIIFMWSRHAQKNFLRGDVIGKKYLCSIFLWFFCTTN